MGRVDSVVKAVLEAAADLARAVLEADSVVDVVEVLEEATEILVDLVETVKCIVLRVQVVESNAACRSDLQETSQSIVVIVLERKVPPLVHFLQEEKKDQFRVAVQAGFLQNSLNN